jgi:protein ImuA
MGRADAVVRASGHPVLDAELPDGGWPCQSLIDILQSQPAQAEWRLLGPSLRDLIAQGGSVLLISANTVNERLWATEQALKTPCLSAVLCWLPQALPAQIRRLHACAAQHPGLLFVFRPLAAQADPSAAPLRLRLALGAWPHPLRVSIVKRRGPALAEPLWLPHWPLGLEPLMQTPHRQAHTNTAPLPSSPVLQATHHADLDRTDPRARSLADIGISTSPAA